MRASFLEQFDSTFLYYSIGLMSILFISVLNMVLYTVICLPLPLQAYGLILDIFGAVLLVLGLFRGPAGIAIDSGILPTAIFASERVRVVHPGFGAGERPPGISQEDWVEREDISRSMRPMIMSEQKDTINAIWGGIFLLTGFIIQIIAILRPLSPIYLGC